jgi:hypothetical protein
MQAVLYEPLEDMAFSEQNQQWIRDQIDQALHPNGFRKVAERLRYWGVLGVLVTTFFALIAIVTTLAIFATNKVTVESEFRGKTNQRLETIEGKLTSIENTLKILPAQLAVTKFSTAPTAELKKHSEELNQLKSNLAKTSAVTPGYWNTAFQVIHLTSKSVSKVSDTDWEKISSTPEIEIGNVVSRPMGNVKIQANSRIVLRNRIEGLVFRNSIIRFDPSVELVNDLFIDCVFIFPPSQTPDRQLQVVASKLLISPDLANVTVNPS